MLFSFPDRGSEKIGHRYAVFKDPRDEGTDPAIRRRRIEFNRELSGSNRELSGSNQGWSVSNLEWSVSNLEWSVSNLEWSVSNHGTNDGKP
jgi:hypothetical protein